MLLILLVVVLVLALGGLPAAPWGGWHTLGYAPSSILVVIVVILVVVLVMGRR